MKFARNLQFNISDKHLLRRGLSGLLALILVLNGFSVAASSAEIETEPADATEYVQETETTGESETTEPATTEPETTEPETTEPETTEPETTDPTDATDATDSTDATDATDATDPSGATDGAAAIDDGASDTEEIEPETFDFSAHVGMNATFNEAYGTDSFFDVLDTEPEAFWNAMSFGVSEFDENVIFRVMAYKVVASPYTSTDETTGEETILGYDYSLWYQVKIISDTPCEGFEDGYWVLQNYLEENPGADLLTLTTPEEPEETDPTDPTDPEETDPTDPTDPPATEPETTEPETTEPETTEPEDETVPSVSGGSGITVSSDSGIPKQATVAVTDHSAAVGSDTGIYDIKVLKEDGTEWQPIDEGKTVTVSIPVPGVADGTYVDVYHFIDYAPDINGDELIFSTDGVDAEMLALLQPAIAAYGDGVHVAVEITENVLASGGMVSVVTDSFSIYELVDNSFDELTPEEGSVIDGKLVVSFNITWFQSGQTFDDVTQYYYASADQQFRLRTASTVTEDDPFSIISKPPDAGDEVPSTATAVLNNQSVCLQNEEGEGSFLRTRRAYVDFSAVELAPGDVVWLQCYTEAVIGGLTCTTYMKIVIVDEVTITFDKNLASATLTNTSYGPVPTDGDASKNLFKIPTESAYIPNPNNARYVFTGWNTSPAGDGTSYTYNSETGTFDPSSFTPMRNMTLYAMWDADNYVVSFDANGGQESYDPVTVDKGGTITLPDAPTRTDYIFIGWSASKDGYSTIYGAGDEFTVNQDTTLYALWAVNLTIVVTGGTVTLQLEDEFESTPLEDRYYTTSSNKMFEKTESAEGVITYRGTPIEGFLRKARFTFTYDSSSMDATATTTNESLVEIVPQIGQIFATIGSNGMDKSTAISFTAVEKGKVSYVVSYIVNYGTPVEANVFTGYEGDVFKLDQMPTTTREGYTFVGWYKDETLTDGPYTKLENITSNINLYAKWTPERHTITFDTDGGSEIAAITQDYNTTVIAPEDPEKTGYTFAGWDKAIPATMPAEDITITAKWTVNSYTVKWIADTTESTESYKYGATIVVPNDPEKEGYTFTGWSPAVPATMPAENLTFTAQWQIKSYAVKFNPVIEVTNGTDLADQSVPHGGTVTLPTPSPVDTGFAFQGWISDGTTYEAGKTVTITGETTFEADWDPKPYEITYAFAGLPEGTTLPTLDKNGGGYMTSVELTQIATYPSFEGYELVSITAEGATSGEEVEITNNTITMPAENVVVTLTYQPLTYTVTIIGVDPFGNTWLDADGNPLITGSVTLNYNEGTTASLDSVMTVPDGYTTTEKSVQIQWNSNSPVEVIYTKADTCYVTIEWGELVFDYTKRTDWDATTHRYYIPPKTDNSNYVTVTNHALSSFAVNASVSVGIDTAYPTMRTEFSESSDVVGGESAPSASIEKGASKTYWLWLYGSMTEAQANYAASLADGAMIGTCTVTITTQGG